MHKQSSIILGSVLILSGLLFLALQMFPGSLDLANQWPLIMAGIGALLLLGAIFGAPPLAIPGSVVTGIGLVLTYQNATESWDTWSFAWTLIPGFVGLGIMLMGLLTPEAKGQIRGGWRLVLISLALFVVFGGFIGAFGQYWPLLLILGGAALLVRGRRERRMHMSSDEAGREKI